MRISTSGTCFCLFGPVVLQYLLNMGPTSQSWDLLFQCVSWRKVPKIWNLSIYPSGLLSNCASALVYQKQDNIFISFYFKIPGHFQKELTSQTSPSPKFVNIFSGRDWTSIALSTSMVQTNSLNVSAWLKTPI